MIYYGNYRRWTEIYCVDGCIGLYGGRVSNAGEENKKDAVRDLARFDEWPVDAR